VWLHGNPKLAGDTHKVALEGATPSVATFMEDLPNTEHDNPLGSYSDPVWDGPVDTESEPMEVLTEPDE
jgi:hypothetical protein